MRETHRFDPERMKMLDSPQRREAFDPVGILASTGIKPGNIGVDQVAAPDFSLCHLLS